MPFADLPLLLVTTKILERADDAGMPTGLFFSAGWGGSWLVSLPAKWLHEGQSRPTSNCRVKLEMRKAGIVHSVCGPYMGDVGTLPRRIPRPHEIGMPHQAEFG